MNRITQALLDTFKTEQSLSQVETSVAFEHFVNYCIVLSENAETPNVDDVWAGGGDDTGLDGIAVFVNGALVTSIEEIDDLTEQNQFLDALFLFIQSKTSESFDTAEFGNFVFGTLDFFSESPKLKRNDRIKGAANLSDHIFKKASLMTKGRPACKLFYVTTGKWQDDANFQGRIDAAKGDLEKLNLFDLVSIKPVDADGIQRLYNDTKNKVSAEITFANRLALPDMDGVSEAYLGVLPATEYLRLILDEETGAIRRTLFYDNVRDFQGDNEVNKEINDTISGPHQNQFAILNNGVTVVAHKIRTVGNRMTVEDYQIVNGCQSSHVLYNARKELKPDTFIPVRIIATEDDDVTNAVIKATNRQTPVTNDDLLALSDFQKKLEAYYTSFKGGQRLYYERRSRQYNGLAQIEKVRIIPISLQIRCIASMFLDEPHRASRYYGTLLKQIGNRIFKSSHDPISYYLAAFANFRIEAFFRYKSLDTRYRGIKYHMLMALRYHLGQGPLPALTANKVAKYCAPIQKVLDDDTDALKACIQVATIIDSLGIDITNRDNVKTQGFTDAVKAKFGGGVVPK